MNNKIKMDLIPKRCHDCHAQPGELHEAGCDVERCPDCGNQYIGCDCGDDTINRRMIWTGIWPGDIECIEFGWYYKLVPGKGRVICDEDDPDAIPDLNRLHTDAVWSKEQQRFIKK